MANTIFFILLSPRHAYFAYIFLAFQNVNFGLLQQLLIYKGKIFLTTAVVMRLVIESSGSKQVGLSYLWKLENYNSLNLLDFLLWLAYFSHLPHNYRVLGQSKYQKRYG